MKRKIFISLNLSEKVKKRLLESVEAWKNLPVKWTKEQNLHVTLIFLGYIADDGIAEICNQVRLAAQSQEVMDLHFNRIALVPSNDEPRMIWLFGETSPQLKDLQECLEKNLDIFVSSKKSFRPHVTLGKIRKNKWDSLDPKPEIYKNFALTIEALSVDVMASDFAGDGPEYTVIESCPLS